MLERLQSLPRSLRALVYAVGVIVVLALGIGVGALATVVVERGPDLGAGSSEQESNQESNQEQAQTNPPPTTQMGAGEYLTRVGDIQNASVEAFFESHEMLFRYDTLTASDVEDMESSYLALRDYSAEVQNLNPPEGYEAQYQLFSLGINELYAASAIAYRVAAEPTSATQVDFQAYDGHVATATNSLQGSNALVDRDYRTTEGVSRVSLI